MTKYRRSSLQNGHSTSRQRQQWRKEDSAIWKRHPSSESRQMPIYWIVYGFIATLLMLSGCASTPQVVYVPSKPPVLPPPTAGITQPIQRDFLTRIESFLLAKPLVPREMETYSKPAGPTTKQ
jgi:hypothetical protein